ncbi:MAG: alpha/beta fold hydrolase [Chloroflexi bacterium]|nr:alpha/beta fold hydrolase [Chloroflexota bacterium]
MTSAAPPLPGRPSVPGLDRDRAAVRSLVRPVPLRAAAAAIAVLLVAYLGICFKYADTLTRVERKAPARTAAYVAPAHEDVSFRADDGVTLRGWWFTAPSPRGRAVVLVHGKDQTRIDSSFPTGRIARTLLERGYSALLFDLRGHGESEGLRWGLGRYEALDIAAAVDLAAQKAAVPRSRVAVVAESMGAGSAAMALPLVPDVGPMVLDSVYTAAVPLVDEVGPSYSGLPSWFTPGMVLMARIFFDIDLATVVPVEQVRSRTDRPFLFIACERDSTVAVHHALQMKAASAHPATQLWVAPDCGHVKAYAMYPAEWERRVLAFLEEQMK